MDEQGTASPPTEQYDPANPFKVGNSLCWLYGDNYRVATVLVVENDRVYVSGMTSDYWISKKALLPRLDKDLIPSCCGF